MFFKHGEEITVKLEHKFVFVFFVWKMNHDEICLLFTGGSSMIRRRHPNPPPPHTHLSGCAARRTSYACTHPSSRTANSSCPSRAHCSERTVEDEEGDADDDDADEDAMDEDDPPDSGPSYTCPPARTLPPPCPMPATRFAEIMCATGCRPARQSHAYTSARRDAAAHMRCGTVGE